MDIVTEVCGPTAVQPAILTTVIEGIREYHCSARLQHRNPSKLRGRLTFLVASSPRGRSIFPAAVSTPRRIVFPFKTNISGRTEIQPREYARPNSADYWTCRTLSSSSSGWRWREKTALNHALPSILSWPLYAQRLLLPPADSSSASPTDSAASPHPFPSSAESPDKTSNAPGSWTRI